MLFFPSAFGGFGDEALFDGAGGDANVADFPVDNGFDALEVGHETPLGDGGDVHANAALFLGFTTAPNDAALDRALTG